MIEILIDFLAEIFIRGWVSRLGANIRFFILRFFKDESEIAKKIYGSEGVIDSFFQEVYNAVVGFFFIALFIFGIVWIFLKNCLVEVF